MDKTVIITGCSTGIGHACAHYLKDRNYRVFATARKEKDVEQLASQGFEAIQLDVNDSNSIQNAMDKILTKTNEKIYGLVNNAGYGQIGAIEDLSRKAIQDQFETNVFGLMELSNAVIPFMRKQGYGRIINISSVLGFAAIPYIGAYTASKFAVEGLSHTLRMELHTSGIKVSLIQPGPIKTSFGENSEKIFSNHIDKDASTHGKIYQKLFNRKQPPFALPPEAVAKKVLHALEASRPKPNYFVTMPTYMVAGLKRILPTRSLYFLLRKVSL